MKCFRLRVSASAVSPANPQAGHYTAPNPAPENVPVALAVRLDFNVLVFTALAAIASGILFGIAPAWQISRLDRYDTLKEGGRSGTAGKARQRLPGR